MKPELEVVCKELIVYEVKLRNKPTREFYQEEKALEFIAENINDFIFMHALYSYRIDTKK